MHFVTLVPLWLAILFVAALAKTFKVPFILLVGTLALAGLFGWGIYALFSKEPTDAKGQSRNQRNYQTRNS